MICRSELRRGAIFEPSEHSLDTVASFVTALVVFNGLLARLATGDAGRCAPVYKGFAEPVSIISSVNKEPLGFRQAIHSGSSASIIAYLTCSNKQADRATTGICNRMQLGPSRRLCQSPAGQGFMPPLVSPIRRPPPPFLTAGWRPYDVL